jgi:general secretion pathway protein D
LAAAASAAAAASVAAAAAGAVAKYTEEREDMRKANLVKWLMVLIASLVVAAVGSAQTVKRFDLVLEDADIESATRMLATQSGLDLQFVFMPSDKPYARIRLSLTGVTVDEAIRYICEAAGAGYKRDAAGVYIIGPKEAFKEETTKTEAPVTIKEPKVVRKILLTHSHPRHMLQLLRNQDVDQLDDWHRLEQLRNNFFPSYFKQGNNGPIVANHPGFSSAARIAEMATGEPSGGASSSGDGVNIPGGSNQGGIAGGGGRGGGFGGQGGGFGGGGFGGGGFGGQGGGFGFGQGGNINLQGGQGFIPDGIDEITYDPTDNSLIVRGTDSAIQELENIIRRLDVAPKQVLIKVEYITTSNSVSRSFGIDWLFQRGQVLIGNTPGTQARAGDPFFVNYATGNVTTRLRMLLLEGYGQVVNAPFVRTLNNQPAFIIQQIQTFVILTQVIAVGNGQVINAPQLVPITVQTGLSVQPRINADGTITMTISPQVAEFGEIRRAPDGTEIPDVLTQAIFVTARVKNGETILLGGLNRKRESFSTQRYPILSDLPLIGNLFRSSNKTMENQELLVFITPTIVEEDTSGG